MAEERARAGQINQHEGAIFTVTALNRSVRDLLEHRFPLIWVGGEISNFTAARSGHLYFSLKDEQAQVRCVMFRNRGSLLDWQPRDGLRVEVRALITLYEPRGDFQLNVEFMRLAGRGALYEAFLQLRDRLEREGLFATEAKRALPGYPRAIGVVTSLHAAALRDVLTTLARRNPAIPVIVYPTPVQGELAPAGIVAALEAAARHAECDVLILCRGGGSLEDLWAFNDERVARAIRACALPVVVGVGHETDFTIADFAADVRAPTPTAAAEMVSPARDELLRKVAREIARLQRGMRHRIEVRMQRLDHITRRLVHPGRRLDAQIASIAHFAARLDRGMVQMLARGQWQLAHLVARAARELPPVDHLLSRAAALARQLRGGAVYALTRRQARLDAMTGRLAALDPHAVLARGFSIVRDADGRTVRDAAQLAPGDRLALTFARGGAEARVERTRKT